MMRHISEYKQAFVEEKKKKKKKKIGEIHIFTKRKIWGQNDLWMNRKTKIIKVLMNGF
jgi:hypothetical protein